MDPPIPLLLNKNKQTNKKKKTHFEDIHNRM